MDEQGNTDLHLAVQTNQLHKVWSVMKKNIIDLNIKNKTGDTALHVACKNHNMDIIEYIYRFGGKMNIKNLENKTPLDYLNEIEKKNISEFEDKIFGQGKYKYIEKEENTHYFMGTNDKRIRFN